jgi:hypothetical protein
MHVPRGSLLLSQIHQNLIRPAVILSNYLFIHTLTQQHKGQLHERYEQQEETKHRTKTARDNLYHLGNIITILTAICELSV